MPKKLQIKLLSQSAELLNVTNCAAGSISVLRSESPSELRPYQRALSGIQGRERFVISVDGAEYQPDQHNLIGFGEAPPHSGLTVDQYLTSAGLIEGSIAGLLMSYGIEGIRNKPCSSLSPDEERKVRLFAATADPSKALILNEPFEPIASTWRERLAEFLVDFTRTKNGLVVIASLSYRPDSWIDNSSISRLQVGQSLRKTIGFGAAGSDSTMLINQLRDQIRDDAKPPPPGEEQRLGARASLGAAALSGALGTSSNGENADSGISSSSAQHAESSGIISILKTGGIIGVGGAGIWIALNFAGLVPKLPWPETKLAQIQTLPTGQTKPAAIKASDAKPIETKNESETTAVLNPPSDPQKQEVAYLLDNYPPLIRTALLDTARGIIGAPGQASAPVDPAPAIAQSEQDKNGNLYKLLESASTDTGSAGGAPGASLQEEEPTSWSEPEDAEESSPTEQDERREAIREKFLEAIRAAAERREAEEE